MERPTKFQMAESQLAELRNMRLLLEEARLLVCELAYPRRVRLEAEIGSALEEVERQIQELRGIDRERYESAG